LVGFDAGWGFWKLDTVARSFCKSVNWGIAGGGRAGRFAPDPDGPARLIGIFEDSLNEFVFLKFGNVLWVIPVTEADGPDPEPGTPVDPGPGAGVAEEEPPPTTFFFCRSIRCSRLLTAFSTSSVFADSTSLASGFVNAEGRGCAKKKRRMTHSVFSLSRGIVSRRD
jgi:hypothetical protein